MKKSEDKLSYPTDKLLQALYWIWDAFERSSIGMFLVYKTAEDVIDNKDLEGDKITVGVRDLEWISGSTPILRSFVGEPKEKTDKYEVFKNPFNEVPVYVYIFKDHPCIQSTRQIFYKAEYFMVPNTYTQFKEIFGDKV